MALSKSNRMVKTESRHAVRRGRRPRGSGCASQRAPEPYALATGERGSHRLRILHGAAASVDWPGIDARGAHRGGPSRDELGGVNHVADLESKYWVQIGCSIGSADESAMPLQCQ